MKTKLLGKITLLAFVLMVTLSFGSISPMLATVSAETTISSAGATGYIIELTDYQSSYDLEDTESFNGIMGYKLPTPKLKNWHSSTTEDVAITETNFDVTVTNSSGREVAVAEDNGTRFIQVGKSDRYTVTYTATNESGVVTATRNVTIDITAQDAEFEFDSNSAQILPTVVEAGDNIVFPWPKVKTGDGDDDYVTEPNIVITLEGPTKANEGATSAVTQRELGNQVINNVNHKTYKITENDTGTFTVTYTYNNSGTDIVKKFTFNVVSTAPEVKLAYSGWSSSIENLTLSVGQEAVLPTPTVINTAQNNVTVSNVYTEVSIVNTTTNETYPTITDFRFTPDEDGDYRITYVTKDFTGATVSYTTLKNHVKKTGDSITIKVVDDYSSKVTVSDGNTTIDASMSDIDAVENADYAIPTNVYLVKGEATVTFPAIYATAGWGDYDNLHLTRQIYKRNSSQQVLELQQKPNSSETYKPYEAAPYKFTSEGEYSIRYIAYYVDDEGKEITGTTRQLSFSFTVHDVDVEPTVDLTVTAPNVTKAARKGSTITFSAPTATSLISGTNEVADANIKLEVVYKFNFSGGTSTEYTAELNDDNVYEINIDMPNGMEESQWDTVTSLEITFRATDDFHDGVPTEVTRTVNIVDFAGDNTAPQLTEFDASVDTSEAGVLTLPKVTFTDNSSISLVAYVLKGNSVMKVINASTGTTATIQGATYTPTEEGTFTITYVATDQNNNISTISVNYTVDFHNGYSVSIDNISAQQYGTVINLLDYVNVTDHGEAIDMADMTVRVVQDEVNQDYLDNGTNVPNNTLIIYVSGDFSFPSADRIDGEIVTLEGDITVRAWAKDAEGVCDYTQNGSSAITFSTSDSTNPTFTIEDESLDGSNYEFTDSTADNEIELPWFDRVIDNESGINPDSMKIELYYQDTPDDIIHTFTSANIDSLKFTPNRQGKINAVYSVSDIIGNTYSRTFVLNIGDVTPPEIVLNDAVTADDFVGGKLTIDLSKIDIDNDSALDPLEDITITITRDGTDVEFSRDSENRNIIEITMDTAGTYVVTFDTEDAAGNAAQTITKTFNISAGTTAPVNSSTIWGTVLIIVALIVLGLVIFFFVKPSKSKITAPKTTVKKDDDKKNK